MYVEKSCQKDVRTKEATLTLMKLTPKSVTSYLNGSKGACKDLKWRGKNEANKGLLFTPQIERMCYNIFMLIVLRCKI